MGYIRHVFGADLVDDAMKRHLDIFSGIGGFALAAQWTGAIETIAFCEIDPFCQKVLAKNFPGIPCYDDVRKLTINTLRDAAIIEQVSSNACHIAGGAGNLPRQERQETSYRNIDILTGGFPCQPFSIAGKRRGTEDDRHIWPEMLRLIAELRPAFVVGENVAGFVAMALDTVYADLEAIGYSVRAFVIPACAVGAWHRRDRCWIVAHTNNTRLEGRDSRELPERACQFTVGQGNTQTSADAAGIRRERSAEWKRGGEAQEGRLCEPLTANWWETESRVRGVPDGVSRRMDRHRTARLRALGNAIVPQVAYPILKWISEQ